MTSIPATPVAKPLARSRALARPARWLYTSVAALLLIASFLGFYHFYTQGRAYPGRSLTPPIRGVLIAHGLSMTLWMVLFVIQPLLIATRKHRVHIMLGKIGAVLAALIVVLGLWVAFASAQVNPPELKLWNLPPHRFVAVPFFSILLFGVFVAVGVWKRRSAEIHRPMMLLATLAVIPAALDRIAPIPALYDTTVLGPLFGPYLPSLVIGLAILALKRLTAGTWNRWFIGGLAALTAASVLIMLLARSSFWDQAMSTLLL